jgi:hypothetical protein
LPLLLVALEGIDCAVEPFGQQTLFALAKHVELGRHRPEGNRCGHRPGFETCGRISEDLPENGLVQALGETGIAVLYRCRQQHLDGTDSGRLDDVDGVLLADP